MHKFLYPVLFCLLFVVLLLSSCAGNVPELMTKSKTETTATTTSQPPVAKLFPTEILSPNDSLELVSVTPASGTILKKGTRVQFKVIINYKLNSVKSAFVRADLGIESGRSVGIARVPPVSTGQGGIEILQGSGTVVVEDTVDIDFLTEKVSNDNVYLMLSLYYFKSETKMLIVYRVLKDYYFNIGTPP